jgi:CPA1 family monovalent cation:H+ antiporter
MEAVSEKLEGANPQETAVGNDLLRDLGHRAKQADQLRQDAETGGERLEVQLRLRLTAIEAARAKLLADHKEELDTEALGALVAELDLEEEQIRIALGER